ncbi:MAG: SPOR domain-containing protein [Sphingomonadales bacterium]|nr:SPOR domain-containing protein [Sphingomonadales bacterium]MBD3773569.1 SPOR domain-containing protein [Paracoccaceae bacterium]
MPPFAKQPRSARLPQRRLVDIALLACGICAAGPLMAQAGGGVSQAVVQPLPPEGVDDLNGALQRLAHNPQDVGALIDAGNAALKIGDTDGAIGFFGRADELSPGNPQVKMGLAAAFVRSERPVEALKLFSEAEAAGASSLAVDAERGLAFDLVGDNVSAQAHYRRALAQREDPETRRRLALSQAIAGDRTGFEATLLPLLQKGDRAAFRTRAFGLAVLGSEEEAVTIATQSMPPELAGRISPYLRYMPKLTRAQQAAAGDLGVFPRAAQIGRDDPRIAAYAGSTARPAPAPAPSTDARLAPAGEALGAREDSKSGRRRPGRGSSAVDKVEVARADEKQSPPVTKAEPKPAATRVAVAELPPKPAVVASPVVQKTESRPVPAPTPTPTPAPKAEPPAPSIDVARATPVATTPAASSFDLGSVAKPAPSPAVVPVAAPPQSAPVQAAVPTPVSQPTVQETPPSVAEAFSDLSAPPSQPARPASGAVDITKIAIPREKAEPPPPPPPPKPVKPPKPVIPSRIWVQLATGKDTKALAFDWRRFTKKAPKLLEKRDAFTTPWGQANRLLTGPFDSAKAARDMVTKLKEAGIDSFTFTSAEGEEVSALK